MTKSLVNPVEATHTSTRSPFMLNENDTFEQQVAAIVQTHRERNIQYMESPLTILPVESWLTQVAIKGVRAQQAVSVMKVKEELIDTAVYALMTLEQIDAQDWQRNPTGKA